MFSTCVNILPISREMSCLSWILIAGLTPRAFSSPSLAASDAPSAVFTMTCMSAGSARCGVSTLLSRMIPLNMSLPS